MENIKKKDTKQFNKGYKKLSKDTFILLPPIKEKTLSSLGVYYGMSESKPIVAKCYDAKSFDLNTAKRINNFFYIIFGEKAKLIATRKYRYYIAPYSNAGTLQELIDKNIKFTETEVSSFLLQISKQLSELSEEHNLYHGELTPEHILINIDSNKTITYKICGFGHYIIKPKDYYRDEIKVNYLDPRVIEDPYEIYNSSCDVWSLGRMCLKLVTGNFGDEEERSLVVHPREYLRQIHEETISIKFRHVISRCLFENPKFRIEAKNICFQPFFIPQRKDVSEYDIGKKLGEGGFSKVYLACPKINSNKKYAAKVVDSLNKLNDKQKLLVLGELPIFAMLRESPYVVKMTDYFEYNGNIYLMLDYFNGGDLSDYLKGAKNKMKGKNEKDSNIAIEILEDIRMIAFNLAHALHYMHQKGIMHRDIKPPNLLIKIDERTKRLEAAKLSDFGTSRELLSEEPAVSVLGSPGFTAPEVMEDGYGIKVDVWGYGAILYVIAYGEDKPKLVRQSGIGRIVDFPEKPLYNLPESFIDLIKKCLVIYPEERYSIEDVIKHPYFFENPCAKLKKIPKFYSVDEVLIETPLFSVNKVTYSPTGITLLLKKIKADPSKEEAIIKALNELIIFRECMSIFKLHHCFMIKEDYFFILDYAEGKTLKDYTIDQLSKEELKEFISDIGNAIATIHSHKLKHGNISPSTIYLCPKSDNKPNTTLRYSVKVAGYNNFVQDIIGVEDEDKRTNDVCEFGKVVKFILSKNECVEDKKGLELADKCIGGEYKEFSKIMDDKYFT